MSQLQVVDERLKDANGETAKFTAQVMSVAKVDARRCGIFAEHEIRAMRSAFERICERLGLHPGSGEYKAAAMAIVYRAESGGADEAQLVEHFTAGALNR